MYVIMHGNTMAVELMILTLKLKPNDGCLEVNKSLYALGKVLHSF